MQQVRILYENKYLLWDKLATDNLYLKSKNCFIITTNMLFMNNQKLKIVIKYNFYGD